MSVLFRQWLSVAAFLLLGAFLMRMSLGATAAHSVSIANMQFNPASIRIEAGESVTWINNGDRDHKVVAADGSFASPNLSVGQSFTHTFARGGEYAYGCQLHPREKGMVVVK